jgi:pimeloyl-ACP methyl ester carboxylesterase
MFLLGVALLALLVMAILAPIEALGWWAGWRKRETDAPAAPPAKPEAVDTPEATEYIVYLSGIGKASGRWSFPEEADFIARLKAALPGAVIIDDLFPYAVTFRGLEEERGFNMIWRFVNERLLRRPTATIGWLVNIRNMFQVAVSVDHRYGPFFNLGAAESVLEALRAHGYPEGSGRRVVMIGYSGGAQVSLGAATYLAQRLAAPILVIAIGGVMSADPGCRWIQHLHQLLGADDGMDRVGRMAFAGRWPSMKQSPWNQILAEGKITPVQMGPMAHNGALGYFGPEPLPDGRPRVEHTVEVVRRAIVGDQPAQAEARPPAG